MASHRSGLAGAWAGIAFVGLALASFLVSGGQPDNSKDNAAQLFQNYYAKDSNQTQDAITWILMIFAVLAFVWFLSVLWSRLRVAEGQGGPFAQAALLGGGGFALLLFVGVTMFTVVGTTLSYTDAYKLDPNDAIVFQSIGFSFLVGALLGAGGLATATFIVSRKARVIPTWIAWFGLVIGILSLGIFFTAFFLFPVFLLWTLLVSGSWILSARKGSASPAAGTGAP